MRILVTGGAGFIGSQLCERVISERDEVICLDNFFTGSKESIRSLLGHYNFEVLRHDVITPIDLEVDRIYNLACPASPVHYQFNPVRTIQANVLGVANMLELARRTKARILQASTSEVYGDPNVHPQTESYWGNVNPIGVRSCYDEGKRVAETLMFDYHRQHNIPIKVARIFNTYGPRMALNDGRVVSNFIIQALTGQDITIYGDGSQTRSFCFVDDLIEGLVRLMESDGFTGPEPRKSRGVHDPRSRGHRDPHDGVAVEDRPASAAERRSAPAQSRDLARARETRLGAARAARAGAVPHDLLFREEAQRRPDTRLASPRTRTFLFCLAREHVSMARPGARTRLSPESLSLTACALGREHGGFPLLMDSPVEPRSCPARIPGERAWRSDRMRL